MQSSAQVLCAGWNLTPRWQLWHCTSVGPEHVWHDSWHSLHSVPSLYVPSLHDATHSLHTQHQCSHFLVLKKVTFFVLMVCFIVCLFLQKKNYVRCQITIILFSDCKAAYQKNNLVQESCTLYNQKHIICISSPSPNPFKTKNPKKKPCLSLTYFHT